MSGRGRPRRPLVVILSPPGHPADGPLSTLLVRARSALIEHQRTRFVHAGAEVLVVAGRDPRAAGTGSFGARLATLAGELELGPRDGLVILGAGAVPLLRLSDARRLVTVAATGAPVALTNNRYSSDVCALGHAAVLRDLPPLPSDNALPRWLEERVGWEVAELPGRDRLGIDLDTPQDLALLASIPMAPRPLRELAARDGLAIPRLAELRALAADPRRELLVAGRSGSRTLAWLERSVRCRVRFLAEERGLRASSDLAIGGEPPAPGGHGRTGRPPRSTLGRLLAVHGPEALASIIGELADGAIVDTRVLLADRLGAAEETWPSAEDRYASDLLRPAGIVDPWLRALTEAAARAPIPILPGAHTLVGPGVRWLLR